MAVLVLTSVSEYDTKMTLQIIAVLPPPPSGYYLYLYLPSFYNDHICTFKFIESKDFLSAQTSYFGC